MQNQSEKRLNKEEEISRKLTDTILGMLPKVKLG